MAAVTCLRGQTDDVLTVMDQRLLRRTGEARSERAEGEHRRRRRLLPCWSEVKVTCALFCWSEEMRQNRPRRYSGTTLQPSDDFVGSRIPGRDLLHHRNVRIRIFSREGAAVDFKE